MLVVLEMVESREMLVGFQLERLSIMVMELKFLQFDLCLVHSLNFLINNSIIIAQN